jgi:hypothetical protein
MKAQYVLWFCLNFAICIGLAGCKSEENRMASATSPYLQQHADNPVDWYEWGDQALNKAKAENKPLLISIGFASCHWCHVMERESFMDTGVARLMNENFVCIKVDREERPDVDQVYMNASQLLTGNAGWPLNAFALPDGKPFYAGTYYTTKSWKTLLTKISTAYKQQHGKVVMQAQSLTMGIAKIEVDLLEDAKSSTTIDRNFYDQFFDSLYQQIDHVNGGVRAASKFPMPSVLEFLLQYSAVTGSDSARSALTNSLDKMALGGIYDQAGGGFSRYTTDSLWNVPHFEKMLYDNAQLISIYAQAYKLTRDPFYKQVAKETIGFVQDVLAAGNGGYYSSVNADSEAGEGAYYLWTNEDFRKTLPASSELMAKYYGVDPQGNFSSPGKDAAPGKNILRAVSKPQQFASAMSLDSSRFLSMLADAKKRLLKQRNLSEPPSIDKKMLTAWNAMMITAHVDAFTAFGDNAHLKDAIATADFIESTLRQKNGDLVRSYNKTGYQQKGFLEDYAQVASAYIKLYEVTFDKNWLVKAREIADKVITNFHDDRSRMFFNTPADATNIVIRKLTLTDDAMPSANSVMCKVLYRLGLFFSDSSYSSRAEAMLARMSSNMMQSGQHQANWGSMAGLVANGTNEIIITGLSAMEKNLQLQEHYLPMNIYIGHTNKEELPLLEGRFVDQKTYLYVCVNRTCKKPVETAGEVLNQLAVHRTNF